MSVPEPRWPIAVALAAVVGLQLLLPDEAALGARRLLPVLEVTVLLVVLLVNPATLDASRRRGHRTLLALTTLIGGITVCSAVLLVYHLVLGQRIARDAGPLLATGAVIWTTNVVGFGLWYWLFDSRGPAARARATELRPDFLFPQMQYPHLAPDWQARFVDYLYVSFTNSTAFSPSDTLPLARWAKVTMLVQAAVSLVTVAFVVARAVGVLR